MLISEINLKTIPSLHKAVQNHIVWCKIGPKSASQGLDGRNDLFNASFVQVIGYLDTGFLEFLLSQLYKVGCLAFGIGAIDSGICIGTKRQKGDGLALKAKVIFKAVTDSLIFEVGFDKHW